MGVSLNKKGFGITTTFYAIIVFGIIIVAIGVIFTTTAPIYGNNVPYDLETFNKNDNISQIVQSYQSRLSPDNANPGTDFEATTYTGAFGIISSLFTAFDVAFGKNGIIVNASNRFGVPAYITQGILMMMLVGVVMGIVAIIFRLGRRP